MASTFKEYKMNYRVEKSKIDRVEQSLNSMVEYRKELVSLLLENNEKSNNKAMELFLNQLKPLQDEQANLLKEIGLDQNELAKQQYNNANNAFKVSIAVLLLIFIIAVIIAIILINKLVKIITRPIFEIEDAAKALYEGDFSKEITYESEDELGQVCDSMRASFAELKRVINIIVVGLGMIADGNFALEMSNTFKGELAETETATARLLEKLNIAFGEIKSSSDQISMGAE